MEKIVKIIFMAVFMAFAATASAEPTKIAVNQFVEHPALNAVLEGFKDDLKENLVDVLYKEYNAHGNMGTANQIATQIASDEPDLIVAIATPSAQAAPRYTIRRRNWLIPRCSFLLLPILWPPGWSSTINIPEQI